MWVCVSNQGPSIYIETYCRSLHLQLHLETGGGGKSLRAADRVEKTQAAANRTLTTTKLCQQHNTWKHHWTKAISFQTHSAAPHGIYKDQFKRDHWMTACVHYVFRFIIKIFPSSLLQSQFVKSPLNQLNLYWSADKCSVLHMFGITWK